MDSPDLRPRPAPPWKRLAWPVLAILVAGGIYVAWQHHAHQRQAYRAQPPAIMGTETNLIAVATGADRERAHRALEEAEAALRDVEARMSSWIQGTELSLLNDAPADELVPLSAMTMDVLRLSRRLADQTQGAFDVTCRPVIELWKRAGKSGKLPAREQIDQARQATGWRHFELSDQGARKKLAAAGLDLGGVAKGYGIDKAVEAMRRAGIESGLVDVGGDVRTFGLRADGNRWRVGLRDPFHTDRMLAALELGDASVCTSGNYFRNVTVEGKRFSHIVDPRTGQPVDFAPSVTVVARDATTADAWATALSVLGKDGLALIGGSGGIEALVFEGQADDYRLYATSGFRQYLAEGEKLPKDVTIIGRLP